MRTLKRIRRTRRFPRRFRKPGLDPFVWGMPYLALESDRILGVANVASLTSWSDFSGMGNDATEATNPPTYITGAQNNYPAALFDGGNDILTLDSLVDLTGAFTVVLVASNSTTASTDRVLGTNDDGNVAYVQYHSNTVARCTTTSGVKAFTHAARGTSVHVDIFTRDSANELKHYMDGTLSSGTTTQTGSLALNTIGAGSGGAGLSNHASVRLYTLYAWPLFHDAPAVTALTEQLKRKFAL